MTSGVYGYTPECIKNYSILLQAYSKRAAHIATKALRSFCTLMTSSTAFETMNTATLKLPFDILMATFLHWRQIFCINTDLMLCILETSHTTLETERWFDPYNTYQELLKLTTRRTAITTVRFLYTAMQYWNFESDFEHETENLITVIDTFLYVAWNSKR